MIASFAIRVGTASAPGAHASSPGVGKSSAPGTSFAATLADQVAAQTPGTQSAQSPQTQSAPNTSFASTVADQEAAQAPHTQPAVLQTPSAQVPQTQTALASQAQHSQAPAAEAMRPANHLESREARQVHEDSLASQSSGSKPSLRTAAKVASQPKEAAPANETVDGKADTRGADTRAANEHALDALALNAREPAPSVEAAQPAKSPAKPGAEKSGASAKPSGAPIAQTGAQGGVAQLVSRTAGKAEAGSDSNAGAESGSSGSSNLAGQPAAAAKKVAAFVFKAAPNATDAQTAKPLPAAANAAPSTIAASSAKPATELSRPAAVPFAHETDTDPTLHVSLLPQAAHLRMDVDGVGDLSLHLRMRDGQAHVTVSGAAAPLVEARSSDLRSALASQGLSLGQLEQVTASSSTHLGDAGSQQLAQDSGSQSQDHDAENHDDESRKPATSKSARNSSAFTISRSIASASGKR